MIKLKQCPRGSIGHYVNISAWESGINKAVWDRWQVYCMCGMKGRIETTRDAAYSAWNDGHYEQPNEELIVSLLPCPFCGSIPEQYVIGARPLFDEKGYQMVTCKNTHCGMYGCSMTLDKWQNRHAI